MATTEGSAHKEEAVVQIPPTLSAAVDVHLPPTKDNNSDTLLIDFANVEETSQTTRTGRPRALIIKEDSDLSRQWEDRGQSQETETRTLLHSANTLLTASDCRSQIGSQQLQLSGDSERGLRSTMKAEKPLHYMSTIAEDDICVAKENESGISQQQSHTASYSSTYSSSDSTFIKQYIPSSKKSKLVVEEKWKADTSMKMKQDRRAPGGLLMTTMKWIVTVILAILLTACLVSSKLSVLALSVKLNKTNQSNTSDTDRKNYYAESVVMYLYLSVPAMVMLLRSAWYGLLDSTVPWPRRKAVLLTVLSACLDSLGLSVLGMSVLGQHRPSVTLLLMASLLLLPACLNVLTVWKRSRSIADVRMICSLIGSVFFVVGFILTIITVWKTKELNVNMWEYAVAFLSLSFAWLPYVQHYTTTTICTSHTHTTAQEPNKTVYGATSDSHMFLDSAEIQVQHDCQDQGVKDADDGAGWKTSFIANLCRLFFLLLFSFILVVIDTYLADSSWKNLSLLVEVLRDLNNQVKPIIWTYFGLGLVAGFVAYWVALAACRMNMTIGAFALPLVLTTPICLTIVQVKVFSLSLPGTDLYNSDQDIRDMVPAAVFLILGHLLAFGWNLFRQETTLLLRESLIFLVPAYNCMTLETSLTLNRRQSKAARAEGTQQRTKVYICTTMYREDEEEMRQLLESLRLVNEAQSKGEFDFESHIILDGGVRQRELTDYALVLVSLLKDTLDTDPAMCTKVVTPYGLKLSWALPCCSGKQMAFSIHLKDNLLVKNKKRWSQVMYMSYVLDFLAKEEEDPFILTTDADVMFTPDSVGALLDLMRRDKTIGAVCARTHPMGTGPLVWYQVFEYAIGHWFQKTAEHILGSVLCAPGCFSVYRCRALADVLPKYARRVESAFDFLTKDMGEDRWLCTLLLQCGWHIEYCAASENSTNCPSQFEEFYKQRRRWIASTLANLMLILREWKYVLQLNHKISVLFLAYQGLLLFSTLIGPSTVMLVVSGGLSYAWHIDTILSLLLQLLVCLAFAMVCVNTTQSTQLNVAKLYTFLYAVVMTAVVVGTAEQIVDDVQANNASPTSISNVTTTTTQSSVLKQHISIVLPVSVTTLYFGILAGIFLITGLLHPKEMLCLAHGVWYLLCLPSGYLVLVIYSVCNITDSSWGTREEIVDKPAVKLLPWQKRVRALFFDVFFCFSHKENSKECPQSQDAGTQTSFSTPYFSVSEDPEAPSLTASTCADQSYVVKSDLNQLTTDPEFDSVNQPISVEEWLPPELKDRYAHLFNKHGFDSTLFISGMTETELRRIGITTIGHLHFLLAQIALIPAFEIEHKVPINSLMWLEEIGLQMYRDNFRRNHIRQPKEMEILKSFGRKEIERELGIVKDGHIKRLRYAISKLRDPTEGQQKQMHMRQIIDDAPVHYLSESNADEEDFWKRLKDTCLQPDLKAFGLEGEVKVKLTELRNSWLLILAVSNTLWLILISTLAAGSDLTVLGANPVGLVFLVVFGFLFVLQFLTMLLHRLYTLSHFLARVPYRCGQPYRTSWNFQSPWLETLDKEAIEQAKRGAQEAKNRLLSRRKTRQNIRTPPEYTPLNQ